MIPFLDLKAINAQYREELIEGCNTFKNERFDT